MFLCVIMHIYSLEFDIHTSPKGSQFLMFLVQRPIPASCVSAPELLDVLI